LTGWAYEQTPAGKSCDGRHVRHGGLD